MSHGTSRSRKRHPRNLREKPGGEFRGLGAYDFLYEGLIDKTARIAGRQQGRIRWNQPIAAGVDRRCIQRWVADGRLRPVYHGVYAVGHEAPSLLGDYMAAPVLACGDGSALSYRAEAHVMRLLRAGHHRRGDRADPRGTSAQRHRHPPREGAASAGREYGSWHPDDHRPASPAPDLAPALDPAKLTRACHEAWIRHGTTPRFIEDCIARNPGKKGIAKLRAALGTDATLSKLEDGFLVLLRAHGLPTPRTNIDRHGDKVDCHWPALDLTVELMSYRFHASRQAFEADIARRRRSHHLAFSWGDVFERAEQTVNNMLNEEQADELLFGLAPLRVGYAVAQPQVAAELERRRPPASVSGPAAAITAAALREPRARRSRRRSPSASACGAPWPPPATTCPRATGTSSRSATRPSGHCSRHRASSCARPAAAS